MTTSPSPDETAANARQALDWLHRVADSDPDRDSIDIDTYYSEINAVINAYLDLAVEKELRGEDDDDVRPED